MNSTGNNQIVTYDLARFARRIGDRGFAFIGFIKITISLSVFFALLMLLLKA